MATNGNAPWLGARCHFCPDLAVWWMTFSVDGKLLNEWLACGRHKGAANRWADRLGRKYSNAGHVLQTSQLVPRVGS
jgi:hypothetical protein